MLATILVALPKQQTKTFPRRHLQSNTEIYRAYLKYMYIANLGRHTIGDFLLLVLLTIVLRYSDRRVEWFPSNGSHVVFQYVLKERSYWWHYFVWTKYLLKTRFELIPAIVDIHGDRSFHDIAFDMAQLNGTQIWILVKVSIWSMTAKFWRKSVFFLIQVGLTEYLRN